MNKISAVYKIVNTVTNDCYVGSSKNVFQRWASHKEPSRWKSCPDNPMYQDMQKYGVDKFRFQILAPVIPEYLKQVEQEFIEMLKPAYNDRRSKGWDVERHKESKEEYQKEYWQSEKGKEVRKKYRQSEKGKEAHRKGNRKYLNRLCSYNGETLTLNALSVRFQRAGIKHPVLEAKKYLQGGIKYEF